MPASTSPATTVVTPVVFSAWLMPATPPPPLLVMAGASFWLVTVTVNAWVSLAVPSLARTITS